MLWNKLSSSSESGLSTRSLFYSYQRDRELVLCDCTTFPHQQKRKTIQRLEFLFRQPNSFSLNIYRKRSNDGTGHDYVFDSGQRVLLSNYYSNSIEKTVRPLP